jgi:hypothetical protein
MTQICKTNGSIYEIRISETVISCTVRLPPTANIFAVPTFKKLEDRIHDAMEQALSPLFAAKDPSR